MGSSQPAASKHEGGLLFVKQSCLPLKKNRVFSRGAHEAQLGEKGSQATCPWTIVGCVAYGPPSATANRVPYRRNQDPAQRQLTKP